MSIRVYWWLRIVLFAATGGLAASATLSKNDESTRDAALQWLQFVDSGNYSDAALQMAQEIRGTRDCEKYLANCRSRLGRVTRRQLSEIKHTTNFPEIPGVRDYEKVRFQTSFERKGSAIEEVTLLKTGCCWEVVAYKLSDK